MVARAEVFVEEDKSICHLRFFGIGKVNRAPARLSPRYFATLLIAKGETVKAVRELMRHASSPCMLEVYSQPQILTERQAQQLVV
jgi:hypothetical protein